MVGPRGDGYQPGTEPAPDEAAGYHAMTIADSIAYPYESDSKYPYTPDGNREFLDGIIKARAEAGLTRDAHKP